MNDGTGLLLHKRNDGGAHWINRYTIHERRCENVLWNIERGFFKTSP